MLDNLQLYNKTKPRNLKNIYEYIIYGISHLSE